MGDLHKPTGISRYILRRRLGAAFQFGPDLSNAGANQIGKNAGETDETQDQESDRHRCGTYFARPCSATLAQVHSPHNAAPFARLGAAFQPRRAARLQRNAV
jgi:hypothetical protein